MLIDPPTPCHLTYPVVTMGTFDGVHLGHRHLLAQVKKRAQQAGGQAVVLTYWHHPLETVQKKTFPYLLTERETKTQLLRDCGADCVYYLDFTPEIAALSAREFLEQALINRLQAKEIVFGYDTHFGHGRSGDFNFISQNQQQYGYQAFLVEPLTIDGTVVSSRRIRDFIRWGEIEQATRWLGRAYSLQGTVGHGIELGRSMGFPTVNVQPNDSYKLLPADGVYLSQIRWPGFTGWAVTNVGLSPTVKTLSSAQVEAHILDFSGDLYGKQVELDFCHRLRGEIRFADLTQLKQAIQNDITNASKIIAAKNQDKSPC